MTIRTCLHLGRKAGDQTSHWQSQLSTFFLFYVLLIHTAYCLLSAWVLILTFCFSTEVWMRPYTLKKLTVQIHTHTYTRTHACAHTHTLIYIYIYMMCVCVCVCALQKTQTHFILYNIAYKDWNFLSYKSVHIYKRKNLEGRLHLTEYIRQNQHKLLQTMKKAFYLHEKYRYENIQLMF